MAVEDYATQLERVQLAIAAIEGGAQSYSIAGRSLSRADLRTLYDREAYLRRMVDRTTRGTALRVRLGTPV